MLRRDPRFVGALLILVVLASGRPADGDEPGTTPVLGLRHESARILAFRDARIVVSPGRVIERATLVVEDGRVRAVGAAVTIPEGAFARDLGGKTIYPGFLDPYTEYGLGAPSRRETAAAEGPRGRRFEADRVGANAWNEAIHAERSWVESFEPDAEAAERFWKRGVTTVQSVRKDGILRGRGFVVSLGAGLPNDLVLLASGPHFAAFDKGSSRQAYPSSLMGSIALLRQTLLDARWYAEAHAAWERNPAQAAPETNVALAALSGYRGPLVFESEDELSLLRAARIGAEFALPLIHVGSNTEYRRLDAIAALKQPVILPLRFPEKPEVGTRGQEIEASLGDLRHWERAPSNAAALSARGVRLAFTTHGLEPGDDVFALLRRLIRRGLEPEAVLAALTTVPAELMGIGERAGTLDPGKRADFFVADGDPLADKEARIWSVWIAGARVKEFVPLEQHDFRGVYDLTVEGATYRLSLSGEIERPRGRLRAESKRADAEGLEVEPDRVSFHADLGRLGLEGAARFSLRFRAGGYAASVLLPDGREAAVEVVRVPETPDKDEAERRREEAEKNDEELDAKLVSRLTWPNSAFGWETPPRPEDVLVRNATLWTGEKDGVIEGGDLLVRGGKIARIGRNLDAPGGVRVIDATGRHVTAGILDEHSHLAISRGVNEGSHAVTAEVRIGDVVDSDDVGIYRALAGGVTAAQLLHGSANPIGGQAQVIKLRWGRGADELAFAAAPPSIKFALGENVKQSNSREPTGRYPQTRMGVETIMRDAFLAAREYGRAHAEYRGLRSAERAERVPPRRDLQLEALLEILDGRRFPHVHSYVQSEILTMMRLAEELGFRVQTFTHILEGYKVAPEMAAHGAAASSFSDWWAYKFEVYDAIPYNTCLLHDAGVVTSINSDSADLIRRLNQEAGKSVMYCGMEPHEALKLATLNPARQLRVDDRVGSLAAGKDADFVIWSGPPLSAYSKALETWVDGTSYFDLERDLVLRREAEAEKRALVQKALRTRADRRRDGDSAERRTRVWHCDDVEDTWHED